MQEMHTNLSIHQLDDVLLAPEPLQQRDLIHKTLTGLRILALQLDALQGKDLAVGCHHLYRKNNGRGLGCLGLMLWQPFEHEATRLLQYART